MKKKSKIFFGNLLKIFTFIFLNPCLGTWEFIQIFKKNIFWTICLCAQISFLRFYVIICTDKWFFEAKQSILHLINFQKIYILYVVQFFIEKTLPKELWIRSLCMRINTDTILSRYLRKSWHDEEICRFYVFRSWSDTLWLEFWRRFSWLKILVRQIG